MHMPRNPDIESVLLIGAGPIVIGQACEFDYSGSQACRALKEEGIRVVLLNSNPATIMTDPNMADATYIEPITPEYAAMIIESEKVGAVLPTMGGQTALNCAMRLHQDGVLERHGTRLIGANFKAIRAAEDRQAFRELMDEIGLESARGGHAGTLEEALAIAEELGSFPLIIRPSYTLGGKGGGIAFNREQFAEICARALAASPTNSMLIEESLLGWKEIELEVVRDRKDNCIIVCGIENVDPLGVHTGDSVTVAPVLTLTDREYQRMRDAAFKVLRAIGVDTGGANVQFAIDPKTGRQVVIEMNPRVSRSSALASKATGFPIAKVSTKLALGYTLDELSNEITAGKTPASFEPTLDYVVVKVPKFNFDKFPDASPVLGTQMKSVGEAMSLGRTFAEALQKALCSLESDLSGLDPRHRDLDSALAELREPRPDNLIAVADSLRHGAGVEDVCALTGIDPWFVGEIERLVGIEGGLQGRGVGEIGADELVALKREGFSDRRLASLLGSTEERVRERRAELGVHAAYHRVDSCAAEFPTETAYMYSTYGEVCECRPTKGRRKQMILGSGPNRIGQGIEFDYCCIHASLALRESGNETIMVNCNPETVSTDYDVSDRLYFEPLTVEHVLEVIRAESPDGVIVHYGGQTPLSIAHELEAAGAPIIGTSVAAIDRAESRDEFRKLLGKCGLLQPENEVVTSVEAGMETGRRLGYPLVARPSYVLGGKSMGIIHTDGELREYLDSQPAVVVRRGILLDRFLDKAIELDVDAVCDGKRVVIAGILEHIEKAGVHSGDSSCAFPPHSIDRKMARELTDQTVRMASELGVVGLMNVQFAIQEGTVYVLEINPRASRTVPFISKATGCPVARIGALAMAGVSLEKQGVDSIPEPDGFFVKEAVFPFDRMHSQDTILGPEMRSTGEVMGCGRTHTRAFLHATEAITPIPVEGSVLLSVWDPDKPAALDIAREFSDCGFELVATEGTARHINESGTGLSARAVRKVNEKKPTVVDEIGDGKVAIVVNTVAEDGSAISDSADIRLTAIAKRVLYFTTIESAQMIAAGIREKLDGHREPPIPIQKRTRRA